jgi:hypothetical protein
VNLMPGIFAALGLGSNCEKISAFDGLKNYVSTITAILSKYLFENLLKIFTKKIVVEKFQRH